MGRRIRAMVETEFAIVAFVDDAMMVRRGKFRHIALVLIDSIQQRIERGAEIETPAAAVAHIVDPQGFLFQVLGIDRIDEVELVHRRVAIMQAAIGNQQSAEEITSIPR